MSKDKQIAVRFEKKEIVRLNRFREELRMPMAQIVRIATIKFLDESEAKGKVFFTARLREDSSSYGGG